MADHQLRPRRTHESNQVFRLLGGTEDNDLWVRNDGETISSTFVPDGEQRAALAAGANVELVIWGSQQPPVAVVLSDTPIGKPPEVDRG